jgi:hypothetical protein
MKFEIHFSVGDYEDYFVIEADTIDVIRIMAKNETDARGLTEEKNHLWSREIK